MDLQDFEGVTKVTFKKFNPVTRLWRRWLTISDPDEVRRLLSVIRLKPFGNGQPGCIHELVASFQKDSGEGFDVDFCMACFGGCYMPTEFYNEFQRLARRHRSVAVLCSALVLGALVMLLAAVWWRNH